MEIPLSPLFFESLAKVNHGQAFSSLTAPCDLPQARLLRSLASALTEQLDLNLTLTRWLEFCSELLRQPSANIAVFVPAFSGDWRVGERRRSDLAPHDSEELFEAAAGIVPQFLAGLDPHEQSCQLIPGNLSWNRIFFDDPSELRGRNGYLLGGTCAKELLCVTLIAAAKNAPPVDRTTLHVLECAHEIVTAQLARLSRISQRSVVDPRLGDFFSRHDSD